MHIKINKNGRVGRFVARATLHPIFRTVAPAILPRLDRVLHKISRARLMTCQAMVPAVMLVSTGAKTGQRRETPLATMPDGTGFWLVGSNYGRQIHPAWTTNLIARPEAEVVYQGRRVPVRARLLDDQEKAEVWPRLTEFWPSYHRYQEISGRSLRVFRLDLR